ncbi:MAG: glycosyltransferase [Bacteroidaceae bacterium]|nr:glycosyltransferase [Bacteroidaceae bacterium]
MQNTTAQKECLRARGICVIIPVYNNAGTIRRVIEETLVQCSDVIVVNDGSTDGTAQILRQMEGICLVEYGRNRGKGHALKVGFRKALDMGFSFAITLDADAQHFPSDIPRFLEANRKHPSALIVGERSLEGVKRSKGSSFANKFSNFWFCLQTGKRLRDTQTGFRLYPLRRIPWLSFLTSQYEAELELLVFSSWHGIEIHAVPIKVYYPPTEERVSHFRPFRDFMRISLLNVVLCFLAVVYGLPLRICRGALRLLRTGLSLLFFLFFMCMVITPFVWIYVKTARASERRTYNVHRVIYYVSRFIMFCTGIPGTDFMYKVSPKVDFSRPCVIVCNHQSHLDLICQLVFTPRIVFLTNDWVWKNPFYGFLIRSAEYLPVRDGIERLMPQLSELVKRGYSIAVYPEGTRSETCEIGRFHKGAFYIAQELGIDILPMVVYGTGRVLPKKAHLLNKGVLYTEVAAPLPYDELLRMGNNGKQASALRKWYINRYEEISNRIERYA